MPMLDVRPEVADFALLMERRLRENDWKKGWKDDNPHLLACRCLEEITELSRALIRGDDFGAVSEAADVANFAMMIADVLGGLE